MNNKTTFALFFGNRGFFPSELIASARNEMVKAMEDNGYGYLIMDENLSRYGAIETIQEGKKFADFLETNRNNYDGIILCLPNFGDENGASEAFKNVDVPILVQAYPDEIGLMDFTNRRDAFCGKIAMCNVLRQLKIKYTLTNQFTVHPQDESFKEDLRIFAGTCRAVKGLKKFNIGAFGARTTAFKTVRCDEIALQNKRINVETFDLAEVFRKMGEVNESDLKLKKEKYQELSDFSKFPEIKLESIARLGVVIDEYIKGYNLQAIAIRCWDEIQKTFGIAPCLILGDLNENGIASACELDINNAIMMRAVSLAGDYPVMLFDVNNNFNDSKNKCILFHCGPAPKSFMKGKGKIEEHLMFKKTYGEGSGVGINVGAIKEEEITIGSFKTENGKLCSFVAEGEFTSDEIEKGFFGCGKVFKKENINEMLQYMAKNGYRHHVAITKGKWAKSIKEAFENYLEYQIDVL